MRLSPLYATRARGNGALYAARASARVRVTDQRPRDTTEPRARLGRREELARDPPRAAYTLGAGFAECILCKRARFVDREAAVYRSLLRPSLFLLPRLSFSLFFSLLFRFSTHRARYCFSLERERRKEQEERRKNVSEETGGRGGEVRLVRAHVSGCTGWRTHHLRA